MATLRGGKAETDEERKENTKKKRAIIQKGNAKRNCNRFVVSVILCVNLTLHDAGFVARVVGLFVTLGDAVDVA